MQIPIMLTDDLLELFKQKGIDPQTYKPAYEGESIGLDLYYAGKRTVQITGTKCQYSDKEGFPLEQKDKVLLPSGVHVALPKGYVGLICDRGSISKTEMIRRAGVIDPGYTDEMFVNLMGNGLFSPGDKLPAQLIVVKAETDYNVVTKEEFLALTSSAKRKEGKTGSTDTTKV